MPYLKLNNSKINYRYAVGSDSFIISEIVESTCSYEYPVVIRDAQSLDIFFGRSYPNRDYHEELLNSGVSLLLYKPSTPEKRIIDQDYYFELDKLSKESCLCFDLFPEKTEVKDNTIYVDSYTGEEFIWISSLEEYVNIKNLPQNIYSEDKYESWYNRDTLRLCSNRLFSLSEKYNSGDDLYILDTTDKILSDSINSQHDSSTLSQSFEFYNYLSEEVKIYTSKNFREHIILIPDGNNIPNSKYLKDIFPAEKSYHISILLDSGDEIKDLLWLKQESLIDLINSRIENKIKDCGEIKLIKIIRTVTSDFKNQLISCHPRYESDYFLDYKRGISLVQHFSENLEYLKDLSTNERTLAFSIKFPKFNNLKKDLIYQKEINGISCYCSKFLGIPLPGKEKRFFLISFIDSSLESNVISEVGLDIIEEKYRINIDLKEFKSWKEIYEELEKNIFPKYYYESKRLDNKYEGLLIYSILGTVPSYGFSNISELEIIQNQTITHDILSLETESLKRIEFYSKTVGPNDQNIKIKIEPINYYSDKYRITISRFNYSETYDLNLYDTPDRNGVIESLDHIINRQSRLVRCKVFREKPDGTYWKEGDPDGKLPIGEWELKRSYVENIENPEMYWTALTHISETNINEDFLCIPEIEKFLRNKENYDDLGYFKEYEDILNYCKTKNCQALIGNLNFLVQDSSELDEKPSNRVIYRTQIAGDEENPEYSYQVCWNNKLHDVDLKKNSLILKWKNTFVYNYVKDYSNYLVYFLRDMSLSGNYPRPRPAYYIFLRGILRGIYSFSTREIIYSSPIKNPFITESYEKVFELKKTNYLVSDNQKYYYKTYQNHPGNGIYKTSILTRFALSKVGRTLENNKWNFLGKQTRGEVRESIENILLKLSTTYDIYHNIYLSEFSFNPQENSMNIRLSVYIRELVDKPISLDVELNYIY